MGTPVNLVAYFRDDDGHGWQESHVVDGGATDPTLTAIVNTYNEFNKVFRVPLLAGDGYYLGCRASYRATNKKIAAAPIFLDLPMQGTKKVGSAVIEMNLASDAVKMRLADASSQANSDIYIRGVWDDIISAGQLNFGGAVGTAFFNALVAYQNRLISLQYGWFGLNPATASRGNVTGYTQNADGTVTFNVTPTNAIPLPAAGTRISVKFSRINNSKSILNRQFVCIVETGGAAVTTLKQVAASDFLTAGTYIAQTRVFILYDHLAYRRASSRKTGRPINVGRGRLAAATLH